MIDFRPVRLWKLVEPPEGHEKPVRPPKLGPRKSADYQENIRHWAALCEAPISSGAREFMKSDTSLALRAALVAKDEGCFHEFHDPMYRSRWAEPVDPSDREHVRTLLEAAGLDGDVAMKRAESSDLVDRLERDTDDAISRGVFGVPTMFVGDEMFFGNDRFELVRFYLQQEQSS